MASGFSPRPHTRGSGTVLLRAATLVAATGIGILASAAYLWITPPVYEASAELLIEADDPRAGPGPADDGMVETQAALIRSQVILDPLIEIESLQTDPTFAETAHEPVLKPAIRRIKAMLGTAEPEPEASPADYDAVLALLQERLTVRRKDGSNVLEIVMRNPDPDRAAELANSIIDLYFDELDAMPAAGSALDIDLVRMFASDLPGIEALAVAAEKADKAVADFRRKSGLLDARTMDMAEARLRDAETALSDARVSIDQLKTERAAVREALRTGNTDAIRSDVLTDLRRVRAGLVARRAAIEGTLLPGHPRWQALDEELFGVNDAIMTEVAAVGRQLDLDLSIAEKAAARLAGEAKTAKAELDRLDKARTALAELEDKADAARGIYESVAAAKARAEAEADYGAPYPPDARDGAYRDEPPPADDGRDGAGRYDARDNTGGAELPPIRDDGAAAPREDTRDTRPAPRWQDGYGVSPARPLSRETTPGAAPRAQSRTDSDLSSRQLPLRGTRDRGAERDMTSADDTAAGPADTQRDDAPEIAQTTPIPPRWQDGLGLNPVRPSTRSPAQVPPAVRGDKTNRDAATPDLRGAEEPVSGAVTRQGAVIDGSVPAVPLPPIVDRSSRQKDGSSETAQAQESADSSGTPSTDVAGVEPSAADRQTGSVDRDTGSEVAADTSEPTAPIAGIGSNAHVGTGTATRPNASDDQTSGSVTAERQPRDGSLAGVQDLPATADESGREAAADTSSSDGTASSPEVAEAGNTRPGDEAEVSASGPADEATGTDAQGHTDTASGTETQGDQNDGADAIAQNDADGPVLPMARLITSARPPSRPVSPDPAFTFAAGAGIGVLTGLALAFLAGALGTRGQDAYYVVDDEEPGRG